MERVTDGTRLTLRPARAPVDAVAAAEIYLQARHAAVPTIAPLAHADDDVRGWFREVVIPERETWLASYHGAPVAVMVLQDDELDQLYVLPDCTGRGVGSELLAFAKTRRPEGLTLWTFRSNRGAQRFYERHGFVAVAHTDGSGNEEHAPDVRYAWRPRPEPSAQPRLDSRASSGTSAERAGPSRWPATDDRRAGWGLAGGSTARAGASVVTSVIAAAGPVCSTGRHC